MFIQQTLIFFFFWLRTEYLEQRQARSFAPPASQQWPWSKKGPGFGVSLRLCMLEIWSHGGPGLWGPSSSLLSRQADAFVGIALLAFHLLFHKIPLTWCSPPIFFRHQAPLVHTGVWWRGNVAVGVAREKGWERLQTGAPWGSWWLAFQQLQGTWESAVTQ